MAYVEKYKNGPRTCQQEGCRNQFTGGATNQIYCDEHKSSSESITSNSPLDAELSRLIHLAKNENLKKKELEVMLDMIEMICRTIRND